MPSGPDPSAELFSPAREDLAAAEMLTDGGGTSRAIGFHAQQAVEKALKAVLATRGVEFPFTHNVGLLMQLCEDEGYELPGALAEADRLTPYAAAVRYGVGNPTSVDPEEALRWAAQAVAWAERQSP